MDNAARAVLENIDLVRTAGKGEAEKLGHAVTLLSSYFDPMVVAAIGGASHLPNSKKRQMTVLDQTKVNIGIILRLLMSNNSLII